jgi:hypothetical protein
VFCHLLEFTVWPVGTGASRYHNCCIDGGTSPDYYGYHLVSHIDCRGMDALHFPFCQSTRRPVHFRIHKRPSRVAVLRQINPEESCALLGYYASCSTNSLPTFRDNLSVKSSRVKKPDSLPKMYHCSRHNTPQ